MISGWITEDLEPIVNDVYVYASDGAKILVRTILDTGFNGAFCLPRKILDQMALQPMAKEVFELADGSITEELNFLGEVFVAGEPITVLMTGTDSDTALMGMALLVGKEAIFNLKDMTVKVRG